MLKPGEEPPKIEFPCDYPIKILGDAAAGFTELAVSVVRKHAPDMDESQVTVKESSKGRFVSVTVVIRATGKPQIEKIYADLKVIESVKMVL